MQATGVTAIIPAYNAQPFIAQALTSLATQTVPPQRIMVINDASTDATLATIHHWQLAYPQQAVTVINNDTQRGVAATRNRGLASADTPVVLWLDADDEAEPHCLETLLVAQQQHPQALLLAGVAIASNTAGQPISEALYPDYDIAHWSPLAQWADVLRRNPIPSASGVLVCRHALLQAGGFNNVKADDWDAWLRLLSPWPTAPSQPLLHIVREGLPTVKVRRHGANLSSHLKTMHTSEKDVLRDWLQSVGWAKLQHAMLQRPTPQAKADCVLLAQRLGLWPLAIRLGVQWHDMDPEQPALCFAQGLTAAYQHQWHNALTLFSKTLAHTDGNRPHLAALNNQAVCWAWLGQWDKARAQWANLCIQSPHFLDAKWNMATATAPNSLKLSWRALRHVLLPYNQS
jgi:hypothetical protein